jgi:hypothetical protein
LQQATAFVVEHALVLLGGVDELVGALLHLLLLCKLFSGIGVALGAQALEEFVNKGGTIGLVVVT